MNNLLHEMCVLTSRLAVVNRKIDEAQAEAREIVTKLALYASQSATLSSEGKI